MNDADELRYCWNCGARNKIEENFCSTCGKMLDP